MFFSWSFEITKSPQAGFDMHLSVSLRFQTWLGNLMALEV